MRFYKCLKLQAFTLGEYSIVPIRHEDRYDIMEWRNEQIFHLRQTKPLTRACQDSYFESVVAKLFDQAKPNQILFSFLRGEVCVGYGGLVHINWIDHNAEVSFVMNTSHQEKFFTDYWKLFCTLLKQVAFKELNFHKIYTYAFDVRPELYRVLDEVGFSEEGRLKEHCFIDGKYYDVLLHSSPNPIHDFILRNANINDSSLLFRWVNDPVVRQSAFKLEVISWSNHLSWFTGKLRSTKCEIYIFEDIFKKPFGQVRLEKKEEDQWNIDYSIDRSYRGLGLGKSIIKHVVNINRGRQYVAEVKLDNIPSKKIFERLGFNLDSMNKSYIVYTLNK